MVGYSSTSFFHCHAWKTIAFEEACLVLLDWIICFLPGNRLITRFAPNSVCNPKIEKMHECLTLWLAEGQSRLQLLLNVW
jgi:hypothetical protein